MKILRAIPVALFLGLIGCSSTSDQASSDPFAGTERRAPINPSAVGYLEIDLGKETLIDFNNSILPARLRVTEDGAMQRIRHALTKELRSKEYEFKNYPIGYSTHHVTLFDRDGTEIGSLFIFEGGATHFEFDQIIMELLNIAKIKE